MGRVRFSTPEITKSKKIYLECTVQGLRDLLRRRGVSSSCNLSKHELLFEIALMDRYLRWNVKQLKQELKHRNVKGYSGARKAQVLKKLMSMDADIAKGENSCRNEVENFVKGRTHVLKIPTQTFGSGDVRSVGLTLEPETPSKPTFSFALATLAILPKGKNNNETRAEETKAISQEPSNDEIPIPALPKSEKLWKRIAKFCDNKLYYGIVVDVKGEDDNLRWTIKYDDDKDDEDMNAMELNGALRLYKKQPDPIF